MPPFFIFSIFKRNYFRVVAEWVNGGVLAGGEIEQVISVAYGKLGLSAKGGKLPWADAIDNYSARAFRHSP